MFLNHKREKLPLHNLYAGASVFMIGGGRSITPRQLERIKEPGIITASLNEPSHFIRPDIFYCSDLHEIPKSVLEDPKILKFVPTYVADRPIFEDRFTNKKIGNYPGVIECAVQTKSFSRHGYLDPRFLYRQRGPGEKFTPFSAIILINLLLKLGFARIYLVGYDFSEETNPCTYFYHRHHTRKTGTGIKKVRDTLEQLVEIEDVIKIYNCSPTSGLKFFEYKDFDEAIDEHKVFVKSDIHRRSSKERFSWYIATRSVAGGNTVFRSEAEVRRLRKTLLLDKNIEKAATLKSKAEKSKAEKSKDK